MPVFNREAYVAEAIESILGQTFSDFEFIIIDDGSNDDSLQIIKNYAHKDERIRVRQNPHNMGIAESRNAGIQQAQGRLIAFMDSDDISLPERFEKQIDFLNNHPEIAALGTACAFYRPSGELHAVLNVPALPIEIRWSLITMSTLINPSMMARVELFTQHGFWHKNLKAASDFDFWSRVSSELPIANLPEVLVHMRLHPERISSTAQNNQRQNAIQIVRRQVRQNIGLELTDQQVEGLRYPSRIAKTRDAVFIGRVYARLLQSALTWSDDPVDQHKVRQLAAAAIWRLGKVKKKYARFLLFAAYTFWISPTTALRLFAEQIRRNHTPSGIR